MPEAYAILAALCFSASSITVRKGIQGTSVLTGLMVSLAAGSAVTIAAYVISGPEPVAGAAVFRFAVAGLLGPSIGRATGMIGIGLLGPSRSVPVQGSLYPVAAIAFGVVVLGESLSVLQVGGILVVTGGVWALTREEAQVIGVEEVPAMTERSSVPPILFPLMAGIAYASADVFRKRAATIAPDALLGVMVGTVTGLAVWVLAALFVKPVRARLQIGPGVWWFGLSGLLAAAAGLSVIRALEEGDVSVVAPIVAAQPLPVLILSALFLKKVEMLTPQIVFGSLAVVTGTILISTASA